jgi:hypothetical protein
MRLIRLFRYLWIYEGKLFILTEAFNDSVWLKHYGTSRKVACSIPDEGIEFVSKYLIFPALQLPWSSLSL